MYLLGFFFFEKFIYLIIRRVDLYEIQFARSRMMTLEMID